MNFRARVSVLLAGTIIFSIPSLGTVSAQSVEPETSESNGATPLKKLTASSGESATDDKHEGAADRENSIYISREDLERANPQTLRDVFSGDASVSVGGAIGPAQKVYVNSIDELNLAVTVDGVLQNNRVFHHNATNYIDPTLLKAVRVDPGVAPADAGPGALGGSIVYETIDVGDLLDNGRNFGGFATVSYDTNSETFTESGAAYGRQNGFELLGYIKYANGDDYTSGNGMVIGGTAVDFLSYLGKAAYQSHDGHRIEFKGQQVQDDSLRPDKANIAVPWYGPIYRVYDLTESSYSFDYSIEGADGLFDPNVVVGYSESKTYNPQFYARWVPGFLDVHQRGVAKSWTAKAENTFNLDEKNTITAGVDFYDTTGSYSDEYWYPGISFSESADNYGFYAQARLEPTDRFRLSFGGRGDYQRFEGIDGTRLNNFGLSGNVYAAFDLNDYVTVNAGYSNIFGGIDLEEAYVLDALTPAESPLFNYNNLEPVRSENLIAGVKFARNGFELSADAYQTRFKNYRETNYGDGSYNLDATVKGFTLGAGFSWQDGFARVSYSDSTLKRNGRLEPTWVFSEIGIPTGQVIAAEIVHTFAEHGLTVGSSIEAALTYDGTAVVDSIYGEPFVALPSYFVLNAFAEYTPPQIKHLTLRFEANNIFDENYADRATAAQDDDPILYGTVPLYEPGRSFLLMAKVKY